MKSSNMITPSGAQAQVFEGGRAWTDAIARALAECARESIAARGVFNLCLTGGLTPRPLYEALGCEPWRSALDWSRARIFFGDERAVGPAHPDSNYRMANEAWLSKGAIPESAIFRMEGEAGDEGPDALDAAAARYAALMRRHLSPGDNGFPAIDLLLLGMGGDGHTASLFPGTAALGERIRPAVANEVPQQGAWRLTLTFPALNAARRVWFLLTGESKAERVAQVLGYREGGGEFPAAQVRPAQPPVWWLDRAAASALAAG